MARLNRTIEEMLFLSRIEANAVPLDLREDTPARMLASFGQDAQVLAEHHRRRFQLEVHGEGTVACEERWLRQVWLNLLTNAFAATADAGLVTMTSRIGDGVWQLVVEDDGPGLRHEELERIFERFAQFGPVERRSTGSGLGLAISRGIVALHAGEIVAENRRDRTGLRVTVTIPAR